MACRGCVNLQCGCFTANSDTTATVGNGSQYAPFTFRPNYIPFPRPFGHLVGETDQSLDAAVYSLFYTGSPDIDRGGNMNLGDRTRLTVPAAGVYLVGITVSFLSTNTDTIDVFSIRKNGSPFMSSNTFVSNASVTNGADQLSSTTTLLDLDVGDYLELYVERVVGAGSVSVDADFASAFSDYVTPQLWAVWMGGPI